LAVCVECTSVGHIAGTSDFTGSWEETWEWESCDGTKAHNGDPLIPDWWRVNWHLTNVCERPKATMSPPRNDVRKRTSGRALGRYWMHVNVSNTLKIFQLSIFRQRTRIFLLSGRVFHSAHPPSICYRMSLSQYRILTLISAPRTPTHWNSEMSHVVYVDKGLRSATGIRVAWLSLRFTYSS
jgi:hypothetical protein